MTEKSSNINIFNLCSFDGGVFLALRRGINELRAIKRNIQPCEKAYKNTYFKDCNDVSDSEFKLSFIICTTGNKSLLSAVKSATAQTAEYLKDYEIIVVVNGDKEVNTDGFPDGVRVIKEPCLGLSYARNSGAEAASGEILLYMDDDAEADGNLVSVMIDSFEKNGAAIIGGQIELTIPNPRPEILLKGKEGLWSGYTVPYKKYREVSEQYAFPYGACFGVRRSSLFSLGGFPPDYGRVGDNFAGGEETALCFAALKNGEKIGINPAAFVRHNVDEKRFTKEHVRETVRAGILTTYRLIADGYANYKWDDVYIKERIKIAYLAAEKFEKRKLDTECFYAKCELDAFTELLEDRYNA